MNKRRVIIGMVLVIALALQVGCTSKVPGSGEDVGDRAPENEQREIMGEFDRLTGDGAKLEAVVEFINDNIAQVSGKNASVMVDRLEGMQRDNLAALEERFYSDEEIQSTLYDIYKPGTDIDMEGVDQVEHEALRALLIEVRDTGYRVETAEGMYFPIIDYSFYGKYSDYISDDMKEYIDIMATESGEVPAKDAALVIGWDQVVERALRQDKFLQDHPASEKAEEVKELYKKYVTFTLFGLNNTPLFDYNTKAMDGDAKDAYTQAAEGGEEGDYKDLLKGYLEVLEENSFALTDEVDQYRKRISEGF
ncbi:MAG: hypothetical protein ACOX42_02090 [Clostridia bacterium]|nr:hypothetical protein [Clostridiales bacterium]